ncbi:MAG TPA: adenosylcobinamide-GDP ribazoletransferase [Terriglobia bacterium]|nr:adenosylcobinamide-GDP ribazoletransferase [Terriglobia bacterium]
MKRLGGLFLLAVQFLTRVPVMRTCAAPPDALAQATIFFPVVGLLIGLGAAGLNLMLSPHANRSVVVVLILIYLVVVTGGLHEDALADAVDGFGGGWNKDQILNIMRDSRIGSFGAVAVTLSLLVRFVFLTGLPRETFNGFLVAGQVISRWTALPLGFFLPSARGLEGQGARVAGEIRFVSLAVGTAVTWGIVWAALGPVRCLWTILASIIVTGATAAYYGGRIGGLTGDCLGATSQITEAAVYLTGVILR